MDGTIKDVIKFCEENQLMDVHMQTEWVESLAWSVILDIDDELEIEIEYNWYYKDGHTNINKIIWFKNQDNDVSENSKEISSEEALKLRGLA